MLVSAIITRVHEALERVGTDCPIEEVVGLCPDLTWNQVSLAMDYLIHTGQVCLTPDPNRTYRVRVHHAVVRASHLSHAHQ
jgi:hypothetical protein